MLAQGTPTEIQALGLDLISLLESESDDGVRRESNSAAVEVIKNKHMLT